MTQTKPAKIPIRWNLVAAVARKDLKVALRSRAVMLPLILVPLILLVGLPAFVGVFLGIDAFEAELLHDLKRVLDSVPGPVGKEIEGLDAKAQFAIILLGYAFGPLFLILPIMVASIVAADSFAGEKERGTLEALLYTPLTDRELFIGKSATAWLLAVGVSIGGLIAYSIAGNLAAWPVLGRIFLPNLTWLLLGLWVAPGAAGVSLGLTVIVSARVKTLQDAMQISAMMVIPVVLLVIGQISGVLWLSEWLVAALGLLMWGLFVVVMRLGGRAFARTEVLAKQ